ncbi:MAG: hypothetical protein K8I30_16845, partial [Anaerolineae bacterium]|nr:hypothetical protein [Anaerolineae bacterium]
MKRWTVIVNGLVIAVLLSFTQHPSIAQVLSEGDPAAEMAMLGRLNEMRLAAGVAPLKPNETLRVMALDQANYLASLPEIQGGNGMHIGRNGEGPRERALYPQFNWATYGGQPAISEVAAASSEDWAIDFFQN